MIKEPTNDSFFYSQIGALEAELQRVNKEKQTLQYENDILRSLLDCNDSPDNMEMETGK
jgi:regulator of replication initiation timing